MPGRLRCMTSPGAWRWFGRVEGKTRAALDSVASARMSLRVHFEDDLREPNVQAVHDLLTTAEESLRELVLGRDGRDDPGALSEMASRVEAEQRMVRRG